MAQRFDYRTTEQLGEVRAASLTGPGSCNAWLTASGRPGHNRAMVWVQWDSTVSGGAASFWSGIRNPFDQSKVVYGALPGSRPLAVAVNPGNSAGDLNGNALCIATLLTLSPGADVGVLLSALTTGSSFADRVAQVWWTSWIEAG